MDGVVLYKEKMSQRDRMRELADERRQMLLTELLGEKVKVRNSGYKTMKTATVYAEEITEVEYGPEGRKIINTGEYRPRLRFDGEARAQSLETIPRLDVLTVDGWATVWDDGVWDLPPWEQDKPATSAKPTGLKYKAGML